MSGNRSGGEDRKSGPLTDARENGMMMVRIREIAPNSSNPLHSLRNLNIQAFSMANG